MAVSHANSYNPKIKPVISDEVVANQGVLKGVNVITKNVVVKGTENAIIPGPSSIADGASLTIQDGGSVTFIGS